LKHWDKQAPAKRKVISRIPEHLSDYRADPKARTARTIAWLIVHEEVALVDGLERGAFEWTEMPAPATVTEIVAQYDNQHDALTSRPQAIFSAQLARRYRPSTDQAPQPCRVCLRIGPW